MNVLIQWKKNYLPGQRIEIDDSKEYWGTEEWTLYTAIDSSTGFKVGELIEKEKTNIRYLRLLIQVFENYGYPLEIMTDRRRCWDDKNVAQIRDMLSHIDINLYASSNPNAKPKVERSFRTMENDFYYEFLKNNDALTFDKTKKLIIECKDAYNKQYNKDLDYKNSLYKKLTSDEWKKIKISYQVKFQKNQTFNFMKNKYGLFSKDEKKLFVKNRIIKITINCHNEIYYQDLNTRLYADTNWKNKKVIFPSLNQLKKLHLQLLSEGFNASKKNY